MWKAVTGYECFYEVSTHGRVRSLERFDNNNHLVKERILKQRKTNTGYLQITLYKNGKLQRYLVHRLVAETFLGKCPKGYQVNHIDENKTNNRIDNLEYVTPKENTNYGTCIKRRAEKLRNHPSKSTPVICLDTGEKYASTMEAERQTGVGHGNISNVCNGMSKTAGGYRWKFA